MLQPIDDLAVELLLDGDMRHGRGRRGTVPVLLARREPDHVAGMDLLDRAALPLDPAAAGRDDEGLAQRVGVPRRPGPGLERDAGTGRTAGACAWNSGSMRTVPVNQSAGPLRDGCDPILLISIFPPVSCSRVRRRGQCRGRTPSARRTPTGGVQSAVPPARRSPLVGKEPGDLVARPAARTHQDDGHPCYGLAHVALRGPFEAIRGALQGVPQSRVSLLSRGSIKGQSSGEGRERSSKRLVRSCWVMGRISSTAGCDPGILGRSETDQRYLAAGTLPCEGPCPCPSCSGLPPDRQPGRSPVRASDDSNPPPGTRGNPDNIPFIGTRDPKGNPVRLARATGHVSNYAEAKVPAVHLARPPGDGQWRACHHPRSVVRGRRPEILEFYRDQIYGHVPANAPKVSWEVSQAEAGEREGTAIVKRAVGRIGDKPDGPRMNMTIHLPAKATGPVPLLLSITFGMRPARPVPARRAATEKSRTKEWHAAGRHRFPGRSPAQGWGFASLNYTEIQPDRADRWTEGVIGHTLKDGRTRPCDDEWGTIGALGLGISRAIDYLETDRAVNAKKIAITGALRLGKTVLWAAAQDQRVAAVFSAVSGEMGAALILCDWGETLDDMVQ